MVAIFFCGDGFRLSVPAKGRVRSNPSRSSRRRSRRPFARSAGNRSENLLAQLEGALVSVSAELIPIFIFEACLYAGTRSDFVVGTSFAPFSGGISATAINVVLVPTRVASHGSMIVILVHHAAHVALAHAIPVYAVLTALPRGPILIDPRLLCVASLTVPNLV
jgi:hypothetical protein